MYKRAIEILPALKLQGKTVLIGTDRDLDKHGNYPIKNREQILELVEAIAAQGPRGIYLWMCPQIDGRPCKDLNDFRLSFGPGVSPDRFFKPFPLKASDPAKRREGVFAAAFAARAALPDIKAGSLSR